MNICARLSQPYSWATAEPVTYRRLVNWYKNKNILTLHRNSNYILNNILNEYMRQIISTVQLGNCWTSHKQATGQLVNEWNIFTLHRSSTYHILNNILSYTAIVCKGEVYIFRHVHS